MSAPSHTPSDRPRLVLVALAILALFAAASCEEQQREGRLPGECSDRIDNDGDGLFDCLDDSCFGAPDCQIIDDDDSADDDDDSADDDDDSAGDDDSAAGDDDDSAGDDDDSTPVDPPDPPPEIPYTIVPIGQLTPYLSYFPDLTGGYRFPIPTKLLSLQDQDFQNLEILVLHDDDVTPLGFARQIFTDVGCLGGYCDAIRVVLVYDAAYQCIDVFNATVEYHLKKFDVNRPQGQRYVDFEAHDMDLLRSTLVEPPQVVLDAPSAMDLVSGTHGTAPTQAIYIDYVVPGAAFTCWTVIIDSVETRAILEAQSEAFDLGATP